MPNQLAFLVLFIWPLITLVLFYRFKVLTASFWSICLGFLFLPVRTSFYLPFLPNFDKRTVVALSALVCFVIFTKRMRALWPQDKLARVIFLGLILSPLMTLYGNAEPIEYGSTVLRGYTVYDAFSVMVQRYITFAPFLLGLALVKTLEDQRRVFIWTCIAALAYSILIIYEVRMSPNLHSKLYGFFPHSFAQQVRYGGFRPVVFLGHGLSVAFFVAVSFCLSITLYKLRSSIYVLPATIVALYIFLLLIIAKSIGALILACVFFMLVILPSKLTRISTILLTCVLILYPLISLTLTPLLDWGVSVVEYVDLERAKSLAYRFENEKIILEHVSDKLFFGWGTWARNRVDGVVTDSLWIITMGQFGLLGLSALFGLAIMIVIRSITLSGRIPNSMEKTAITSYALLVAIILIDQLVNSSLSNSGLYWFLIGGLLGRVKYLTKKYKHRTVYQNTLLTRQVK